MREARRKTWGLAGAAAIFVGAALLLAEMAGACARADDFRRAHATADDVARALLEGDAEGARVAFRRLRLLELPATPRLVTQMATVDAGLAALASAPVASPTGGVVEAVHALEATLVSEAHGRFDGLGRAGIAAAVLAALGGLALAWMAASAGAEAPERGPPEAVERLSRWVDAAERREARRDRFLTSMDAVLLDLDPDGRIERASSGAPELFARPSADILGASASSLLALTTEGGEPLDDWRWAAASPQAHLLTDARGTGRLVTLEYWESPEEGATVILRRAGPMHARLRALRELEQTRRTAFADPELMFVHVGPDDRVRSASRGAREQLGVPEGLPSVHDAWAERAGIADVLAEARPVGALEGVRRLRGRQGDALPLAVRVASIPGGGTWFRGLPLGDPGCVPDAPEPAARRPSPRGAPAASRVLVIDEEARIGRSLSRALRDADVELASGGEEGLERVLSAPEAWDLILCDLGTPGVDGVRLHAELRERAPELVTRLVFMAGAIQTERVRRFVQEVAPPLVHKPFDLAEIQAHLDARRRAPSPPSA